MNKILLVPGLHNSGPDHWQSRWHDHFPQWQRMTGLPWDKPDLRVWSGQTGEQAETSPQPGPIWWPTLSAP